MIVARAPLRIPLAGGGTDLPFYAEQRGGDVISAAIDKYAYAVVTVRADADDYLVCCEDAEQAAVASEIGQPFIREALRLVRAPGGLTVHCSAEVAAGNGLGVSSSGLVALIAGLHALRGETPAPAELARAAVAVEREALDQAGGVQDPYIAAYGGICEIRNTTRADVITCSVDLDPEVVKALETNLMLFTTGVRRNSNVIVRSQLSQNSSASILGHYDRIKEIGLRARHALLSGDLTAFAQSLHEHWTVKRVISDRMSSQALDEMYAHGLAAGAVSGKVVGAGGGGCLLFYVDDAHERFAATMTRLGLRHIDFRLAWKGAEIL